MMVPVLIFGLLGSDLYDIEVQFEVLTAALDKAEIPEEVLFTNADAGSGSKDFRISRDKKETNANICFNKRNGAIDRNEYFEREPYDIRYAVERTNAWIDSFLSLLNRFDITYESYKGFNYLVFMAIPLKKFKNENKKV